MTSSTTATPVSTSMTDAATGKKLQVRRKLRHLSAVQILERRPVELPDGTIVHPLKGNWLITSGSQVIDVVHNLEEKYDVLEEGLLVPREVCAEIEKTTGISTTQTPQKLASAVSRLARITIGTVKIEFTPGQLEEIKSRASKRGYTVKQELDRIIDRIKDEIFYRS